MYRISIGTIYSKQAARNRRVKGKEVFSQSRS